MTITTDIKVNTTLKIPFTDPDLLEGRVSFTSILLKDGDLYTSLSTPITFEEHGNGLYTAVINFNATGYFTVFIEGVVRAYVHVVSKDIYSILTDLDDVAQGSWRFNKATGELTLYRQNGAVLRTYTVVDNNNETSRELIV